MTNLKPIVITPGEPAGIGPDILLTLIAQGVSHPLVAIADSNLLEARAQQLGISIKLPEFNPAQQQQFAVIHQDLATQCAPGTPNSNNAKAILKTLDTAVTGCMENKFSALVTGPINKAVIEEAGYTFNGHTGYLAKKSGCDKVTMMFTLEQKKLALVTTHIPLAKVPQHITEEALLTTTRQIDNALRTVFKIKIPKLLMTGLNPHAGEKGTLGREEIEIIQPAITKLQQEGINITGPISADTALITAEQAQADVVISLFHDQLLPAFKTLGFGKLVNLTVGLPFIRTSVDHGTALNLAGTGRACANSLIAAYNLACTLTKDNSA